MNLLTLNDIREWLNDHRKGYQELSALEFPPLDNDFYYIYIELNDFFQYYNYRLQCEKALSELQVNDFNLLIRWAKQYETLGSKDLVLFETLYNNWIEEENDDVIKIREGLYTEKEPFTSILCFCAVFQHLYWDNEIHESKLTENEKAEVIEELKNILKNYYTTFQR